MELNITTSEEYSSFPHPSVHDRFQDHGRSNPDGVQLPEGISQSHFSGHGYVFGVEYKSHLDASF